MNLLCNLNLLHISHDMLSKIFSNFKKTLFFLVINGKLFELCEMGMSWKGWQGEDLSLIWRKRKEIGEK